MVSTLPAASPARKRAMPRRRRSGSSSGTTPSAATSSATQPGQSRASYARRPRTSACGGGSAAWLISREYARRPVPSEPDHRRNLQGVSETWASGRRAWVVWAVAIAAYFLAVFNRSSLAVAGLLAADRFGISAAQLATFTTLQL